MSVPAADLLTTAPLPLSAVDAGAPALRTRGWLRSLEVTIPGAVILLLLFFCFIWPMIFTMPKPVGGTLETVNLPPFSPGHIFGTDGVGEDIMSRILYGGRVSFEVAAAVQVIGIAVGGLFGMAAAYRGGWTEAVMMRILDMFIAFPSLVLILAIADSLGASEINVIWALSAFSIPAFARVARGATLQLRDQPFVVAARLSGTRSWRIMLTHIAPNMAPQLLTFSLLGASLTIILEGALDFLGYGIPIPTATWGNMIASGQQFIPVFPMLVVIPSLFLLVTSISLNMMGDGLRTRLGVR
ncbi:MAG: ABC transporter permease [Actinobacteria bacterium]|nr:ABC transporter permease [Actinomycetota bacterium]